nr:bifunctional adenosylcobinamide kinase/adenosylcobinamide-phosphate guanylyltransferase [uncultured Blautia sp.]
MKLVIGGAFQGKKAYVKQHLKIKEEDMADGKDASYEALFHCRCIYHFHEWIKKGIEEKWDLKNLAEELLKRNPEVLIITNELGYGVVPVDAFDRTYRETTGRICTEIAAVCEQVIRVSCGLGMVIKDA